MSMSLTTNPGHKVRLLTRNGRVCNGYDYEIEEAERLLDARKKYTVEKMEVHNFSSYVYLKEIPGKGFNTVMFDNV